MECGMRKTCREHFLMAFRCPFTRADGKPGTIHHRAPVGAALSCFKISLSQISNCRYEDMNQPQVGRFCYLINRRPSSWLS